MDVVPSCQIPWAIFQQICVKWNHTGLPEDVQNQQRGQRMRMIHIVMMNIIHSVQSFWMCWLSVLSTLCIKCVHYVFTYTIKSTLPSLQGHMAGVSFWHGFPLYRIHTNVLTGVAISLQALLDILTCLTKYFYSFADICGIIYMSHHTMITQLKTFHSRIVHNCYWYADYKHCPWINDALVTGHETWLAYENYIWLTVTSSLHTYPILIN